MFQSNVMKKVREQMGLTQAELSVLVGCKQNTLSQYEHGKASPSIKIAQEFIKVAKSKKIKLRLEDLFNDEERENERN